jgi:glutamine amidotransferase
MIGIIDHGAGNIASVKNAFERIGEDAELFSDPSFAKNYSHLVLPGVGSFRLAMEKLIDGGWPEIIKNETLSRKPLLGICLGMQLLFDIGEEHGPTNGLGLIPGKVKLMKPSKPLKIPHVGWNRLFPQKEHPIMNGVKEHIDFYFVHSYACLPEFNENILATCDHGGSFAATVVKDSLIGMQFHPEKSQPAGLRILQNFAEWDGAC